LKNIVFLKYGAEQECSGYRAIPPGTPTLVTSILLILAATNVLFPLAASFSDC
jgi:hypothetical protein